MTFQATIHSIVRSNQLMQNFYEISQDKQINVIDCWELLRYHLIKQIIFLVKDA